MAQTSKMVNRKVAVTLAILCIATLIGLNFSLISYWTGINDKNAQIQTLNDQNYEFQVQIANLTTSAPKLVSLGVQYFDNRTNPMHPSCR
jgi:hypothetical protein